MEDARIGALRSASSNPSGVWATVGEQVGRWNTTRGSLPDSGTQSRIGIGLPMSNIYATSVSRVNPRHVADLHSSYFGGTLELVSLDGWGEYILFRFFIFISDLKSFI